jgi:3-phosphoshikimate 1-carboxyvinyltransferase
VSSECFDPSGPLAGTITPPADKSISHRAAIFAAMGTERVAISNYLDAEDTNSTLAAMRAIGAQVEASGSDVVVTGVGLGGPQGASIDVGNAGTLMRLLPGWLAGVEGQKFSFDGDASIRKRPVDRIVQPLALMGAKIVATDDRLAPFTVTGAKLRGIEYEMPVASAQVKSCVLIAAMVAEGETTVIESVASRDHTERMLAGAGATLRRNSLRVTVAPADGIQLSDMYVPGDPSSAAFAIAAAAVIPGSRVRIEGSGLNWTRTGFHRIARRMGVRIEGDLEPIPGPNDVPTADPIGPLEVFAGELRGTVVEPQEVPLTIDELPLVALLGCFAEGETLVLGAEELRVKESNRIETVVTGLRGLGAEIEATHDGFVVQGTGGLRGGTISSHGDHRLAMLGAIAGLASREGVTVDGMQAAAVSYPTFSADFAALL